MTKEQKATGEPLETQAPLVVLEYLVNQVQQEAQALLEQRDPEDPPDRMVSKAPQGWMAMMGQVAQ